MNDTAISVVITTYKRKFSILERAIRSVLNQTYKPTEIIVVNDTPKECEEYKEVSENIKKYQQRLQYIADGIHRGACAARNTGLNAANGELIAFLDDDDEWLPQKLELQLAQMQEDVVFVTCRVRRKKELDNGESVLGRTSIWLPKKITKKILYRRNCGNSTSCPLIRVAPLKEIGGFCEDQSAVQDYECWLRLIEKGKFKAVNKPLTISFFHQGDRITKNHENRLAGLNYLLGSPSDAAPDKEEFVCLVKIWIAMECLNNGDQLQFKEQFQEAKESFVFSWYTCILSIRFFISIFRKWIIRRK
jgi:glycosyltransferase involved in cell wall biosynthesis